MLQIAGILDGEVAPAGEHAGDPIEAPERALGLEKEGGIVSLGVNVIVRGRDPSAFRVQLAGKVVAKSVPLVLAGSRDGQTTLPPVSLRRESRRLPRDISVRVAADHVLGRSHPGVERIEEFDAVVRDHEAKRRQVSGRPRLVHRRAQRIRPVVLRALVEDGTVTGELALENL